VKTGCSATFQISARSQNGSFFLEVSKINLDHNHPLTEVDFKMYPSNRRLKGEELTAVNNMVCFYRAILRRRWDWWQCYEQFACCQGFFSYALRKTKPSTYASIRHVRLSQPTSLHVVMTTFYMWAAVSPGEGCTQ